MENENFKCAAFTGVRQVEYMECKKIEPIGNEVLIKMDACAICTWEQRVYTGKKDIQYPFIGGHEISGTVIKLGPEVDHNELSVGEQIVAGVMIPCRNCYNCKNGNQQNCLHYDFGKPRKGLPCEGFGGFSEYLTIPDHCCFPYKNVSSSEAAIIEPLSCVIHSVETADIQLGDTVLIVGGGIMGLLHAAVASKRGACVILADHHDDRLAFAHSLGARYTVNTNVEDLGTFIERVTNGKKVQVIFDTTPSPQVLQECFSFIAPAGKIVLYSSLSPAEPVLFDANWIHGKGIKILGTANSNERDYVRACKLVSEGIISLKSFVSKEYKFADLQQALEYAVNNKAYRVVVKF